ncbi:MAG: CDP-diacylglycerol--glycerol-3-phosphate 3-phosphatidyltransferase [Ornithinimicrobium sp.]|jgi:CDP-diacylglycerol--glycerol-3-phosphate 3-phosphatidyltransferase|uniref:CDP-diacylglycerol--glycerol-3-phosphate 3-phosphatidyltransferase n=1 Tax=Ornithinimicrobium sp. TaxID=1977084 RepID=UPI003D9BB1F4
MPAQGRPGSAWNAPNALTVLRIVLVPLFAWLLLTQDGDVASLRVWAAVVFAVAVATDWLDGDLARRQGLVTDFGKIADPIADKALIGAALIGLSVLGELAWWITVVILVREIGITVMRFVVLRRGVMAAGRGGKLKTVLQSVGLLLLILPLTGLLHGLGLVVMYAALVVTVVTGVDYVLQARRLAPRASG